MWSEEWIRQGILVLDYGNFKAVAIGAKDCSAEIRSTIQGDKGAITIFGATNTLPGNWSHSQWSERESCQS